MDSLDSLKEMIDACISHLKYAEGRKAAGEEVWEHKGEGTEWAVEYLLSLL